MDAQSVLRILRAFGVEHVEYKLVGAIAMSVQGIVRATQDIDFFVRPDEQNVERIRRALGTLWDDPELVEITAQDLAGDSPTIRYAPPGEEFVIDLIARLGEAFDYDSIEAETIAVDGIAVRVATPRMLIAMKRGTLRGQDRVDAEALRQKFGLEES